MSRQYGEPSLDLSAFEHDFELRDTASVLEFIANDPSLVGLLLETREQIKQWFQTSVVFLEVDIDPEIVDRTRLLVSIGTELDAQEAYQALKKFDANWWLKNIDRAKGKVTVTLEFI